MANTVANINVRPSDVTWGGSSVGFIDGDVELTLEEQSVDVTAHQEGTNLLNSIRTGVGVSVSLTLKETHDANLTLFLTQGGAAASASGAASGIIGWGKNKQFTGMLTQSKKLVFHPVDKASADLSEDIAIWKAYPMLETISFSGENPRTMSLSFKCFHDTTLADEFRLLVYGDHTDGAFTATE